MKRRELTPAEYKCAAEQMVACLHNGIGVVERSKDAHRQGDAPPYELNGWLAHACALVTKWYETTEERHAEVTTP